MGSAMSHSKRKLKLGPITASVATSSLGLYFLGAGGRAQLGTTWMGGGNYTPHTPANLGSKYIT